MVTRTETHSSVPHSESAQTAPAEHMREPSGATGVPAAPVAGDPAGNRELSTPVVDQRAASKDVARRAGRKWVLAGVGIAILAVTGYFFAPWVETVLNTVSTDDA